MNEEIYYVEDILDRKMVRGRPLYLIKWQGTSDFMEEKIEDKFCKHEKKSKAKNLLCSAFTLTSGPLVCFYSLVSS
jgi:hypothetical protein